MQEGSPLLRDICALNPFTYAVESIRFLLYCKLDPTSLLVVAGSLIIFLTLAIYAYDPSKGMLARVRGGG